MENLAYCNKNDWYYNLEKSFIYPLVPEGPHKILDLGCGTGRVGKKLLELNKAKTVKSTKKCIKHSVKQFICFPP